jgi:hypothetical protein
MPNPTETIRELHPLPEEARRARWPEGVAAWLSLGNPEQALRWARLGGDPAATRAAEADWASERAVQEERLKRNAAAAERRLAPPALPSLAWNEAKDLSRGMTWILRDAQVDLLDLSGVAPTLIPLTAPAQVEEGLKALAAGGQPFLFGPLGHPRLLTAILEAQPARFLTLKAALFVVEPRLGVFRMLARLFDMTPPLAADHVLWFVGEDWAERLSSFLRAAPGIPVPARKAVLGGGLDAEITGTLLTEVSAWREAEMARLDRVTEQRHAGRSGTEWRAAFAPEAKPRVLFITSRFTTVLQYVVRDLDQAFRSLGCPTATVIEGRDCVWSIAMALRQKVASFRPDLVVQLDHLRAELGTAIPASIPYACWIQDRLPNLFDPRWVGQLGPRDSSFAMWPGIAKDCLAAGYPEVHPLPVAGNAFVYRPPEKPLPPGPEIAFVSNLAVPKPLGPYPGLIERAEAVLRMEGIGYRDPDFYQRLLKRLEKDLGLGVSEADRSAVLHLLSFDVERYVQRTEPLRWARAMGLEVAVYGRGWEGSAEFAPIARGVVQPGEALRDLYASARIHLHMNSDTNAHARVFECLLSGGCILAWAHPGDAQAGGLGEMLEIGREIATFRDRADFEKQVRRYLADDAARREVSEAGRARVLARHTTVHRAKEILKKVRERLAKA